MNSRPSSGIQSLTIGVAFALFAVWMQSQGRWSLFFQAMTGTVVIPGTRSTSTPNESAPSNPPGVTGGGNEPGAPISPPGTVPPNLNQQTQNTSPSGSFFNTNPGGATPNAPTYVYQPGGTTQNYAGQPGYGPYGIGTP